MNAAAKPSTFSSMSGPVPAQLLQNCFNHTRNKNYQARRDIKHNPHKYLSNTILLVVRRPLPLNHLSPTEKPSSFYSPGGMLCGSASTWVEQDTGQDPFLVRVGNVHVLFFSFKLQK
jgi:hypothetical protein